MGTEQTRDVVERYYAALGRGDRATVRALLADDVTWRPPAGAPIEPVSGGDALTAELAGAVVKRLFDLSKPFSLEVRKMVVEGDTAVVFQRLQATAKATGLPYDNQYVWAYTVKDGRIAHMEEHADTIVAARAMGWT
jgi:hypothetical protein